MKITELSVGTYKVPRTEKLKLMMYNQGEYLDIMQGVHIIRVIVENEKSVRVMAEFKDQNKEPKTGRLDFAKNKGDYNFERIEE